jgi:hypothetical protein
MIRVPLVVSLVLCITLDSNATSSGELRSEYGTAAQVYPGVARPSARRVRSARATDYERVFRYGPDVDGPCQL